MPRHDSALTLLVEGKDDVHVVRHLRDAHRIASFEIRDREGFDKLRQAIGAAVTAPEKDAIGIVADANNNPTGRWEAITSELADVGLKPPTDRDAAGTIFGDDPRIGIWLMPDNRSAGELEDFVKQLIPAGDPVWPRAECFINGIPEAERKFAQGKVLRAQVHAWLATRERPRPMGLALTAGDLDVAAPIAVAFTDWLRRLFA